jgi:aryl-alcohol dehydrogenase-like predicted oxidoreductase
MKYRTLGKTGIRIPELFLGAMTFGEQGGVGAPLAECRSMLDAYLDAGGNVIDTAINYRGGLSEEIVGEIFGERRDRFVLASKYTVSRDPTDPNGGGNHRKNLRRSLETSLRRLRTDYLDLYWVHIWDDVTPIEQTMRALDDVVRAGKVLAIGISDAPAWVIARGHTVAEMRDHELLAAIQVPYSLVQRDADRELLPMADAFGFTIAAWSPLAGGLLSGKFTRGAPPEGTRLDPSGITQQQRHVATLVDEIADQLGVTSSQVTLAWTMTRHPRLHPIVGARTLAQLQDNLAAARLTLPEQHRTRLDEATSIYPGFPTNFIAQTKTRVLGASAVIRPDNGAAG